MTVYINRPGEQPFLFLRTAFGDMHAKGFSEFSKELGKYMIYGSPTLLELFEKDIQGSAGEQTAVGVQEVSDEELKQAFLSELKTSRQKVAMIVMAATRRFSGFWRGNDPDAKVDEALAWLAEQDGVLSFGDIKNWRHSEMCRSAAEPAG